MLLIKKSIVSFCLIGFAVLLLSSGTNIKPLPAVVKLPSFLKGEFEDDYGIRYRISDSVWIQLPNTKYHIIEWNEKDQYLIAKNGSENPGDRGLYTRIDCMRFEKMEPYLWGFCLTTYNATNPTEAKNTASADRQNPKKGCGGFPFSRMKRVKP